MFLRGLHFLFCSSCWLAYYLHNFIFLGVILALWAVLNNFWHMIHCSVMGIKRESQAPESWQGSLLNQCFWPFIFLFKISFLFDLMFAVHFCLRIMNLRMINFIRILKSLSNSQHYESKYRIPQSWEITKIFTLPNRVEEKPLTWNMRQLDM